MYENHQGLMVFPLVLKNTKHPWEKKMETVLILLFFSYLRIYKDNTTINIGF